MMERWPSGLRRTPGKRVLRENGVQGSNLCLSAFLTYDTNKLNSKLNF